MKRQIIVIHGGTTFKTYRGYISFLKNRPINLDRLRSKRDWKDTLQEKLGENFEVLTPRMPNGTNARYKEWKIWFERIIPFFRRNVILIGHSLGGIFLAKYLAENKIPKKIKSTILVAAPFDDSDKEESVTEFKLPLSLEKFAEQGGRIYLVQSKDDPNVSFAHLEKYKRALPKAETMIFNDRGHFRQETFPEMIRLLKQLK
jgi:predicted alpha/beta hydrolase family esterase